MAFTISRYLKLKIADDLSSDAKYNLEKIDSLGAIFARDTESDTNIRSSQNISLLPEDPSIGGGGNNSGSITLGDSNNKATITAHSVDFFLRSALSLLNQSTSIGTVNYLTVQFLDDANIAATRTLTIDVGGENRTISFPEDGEVVTTTGVQTLIDKDITGVFTGPLTGNVTGNVSGTASNVTGIVAVVNGGTGASNGQAAMVNLLPTYAGNQDKVLSLNSAGTALEWRAAGSGQVVSVDVAPGSPLTVTELAPNPVIGIAQSGASSDGYLSALDWTTFYNKEPYLGLSNATEYLKGDRTWATLNIAAVSGLQSALNTKYDVSNPAGYVDTAGASAAAPVQSVNGQTNIVSLSTTNIGEGTNLYFTGSRARDEVVVNSPTWLEEAYAPSAAAVVGYVAGYAGNVYATTWQGTSSVTLTHSLSTADITVNIYDLATGQEILIDEVTRGDGAGNNLTSQVTLAASQPAPTGVGNGWRVVVRK